MATAHRELNPLATRYLRKQQPRKKVHQALHLQRKTQRPRPSPLAPSAGHGKRWRVTAYSPLDAQATLTRSQNVVSWTSLFTPNSIPMCPAKTAAVVNPMPM